MPTLSVYHTNDEMEEEEECEDSLFTILASYL